METQKSAVCDPPEGGGEKPWALRDLPPFPAIATRVLQLLAREDVPLQQVVDLIRADAAFSAGILRTANSALFGLSARVETVKHAVMIMGVDRVRALTLTVALGSYMRAALRIEALRRCWRHSLACALASEELARICSQPGDRAFTAGLLHDIGRLGLLVAYPVQYANVVLVSEENAFDLLQTERDLFDIDHCNAGRWLMREWKLPEEYHEVAALHHHDLLPTQFGLLEVVSLGCCLADTLGYEVIKPKHCWTLDEVRAALPEAARIRFDLEPDALRTRIGSVIDSLG
ncbi:MAG: HDOD domain-containing protein [Acidobacteria bacterium]|nr:HDOD domain-containing protein [Acidobacteriota bacterium]